MDSKQTKEFHLESKNGEKRKNKNGPQPSSYEPFLKEIPVQDRDDTQC